MGVVSFSSRSKFPSSEKGGREERRPCQLARVRLSDLGGELSSILLFCFVKSWILTCAGWCRLVCEKRLMKCFQVFVSIVTSSERGKSIVSWQSKISRVWISKPENPRGMWACRFGKSVVSGTNQPRGWYRIEGYSAWRDKRENNRAQPNAIQRLSSSPCHVTPRH